MLLIMGPEARRVEDWQIADLDNPLPRHWLEDDDEPRVYWPAAYWPEVSALVAYDACCVRLGIRQLPAEC